MTEVSVKFGGPLDSVIDASTGEQAQVNLFGEAVLRVVQRAKFDDFVAASGGEAGASEAIKRIILEHANRTLEGRAAELGVLRAVEPKFAAALSASLANAFEAQGGALEFTSCNVNLATASYDALMAATRQASIAKLGQNAAAPSSSGAPVALIAVVALMLLGGGAVFVSRSMSAQASSTEPKVRPLAGGWDGTKPYVCGGNTEAVFGRIVANLPGQTALTAGGNCHVRLDDVTITADTVIEASGSAVVEFKGGRIEASTLSAHASGNARILFKGTAVTGETKKEGNGSITGP